MYDFSGKKAVLVTSIVYLLTLIFFIVFTEGETLAKKGDDFQNAPSLTEGHPLTQGGTSVVQTNEDLRKMPDGFMPTITLPLAKKTGSWSVEKAIGFRRSIRTFKKDPVNLGQVSQLLWAAQGETGSQGLRAAPSAGALYPMEIYLIVENVRGLNPGIYKYDTDEHSVHLRKAGSFLDKLSSVALGQESVKNGALTIVIAGIHTRTRSRYSSRASRYIFMEAGHIAQNIYLQSVAVGLGTVAVGAFEDIKVQDVLDLPDDEEPLYLMPVGVPKRERG